MALAFSGAMSLRRAVPNVTALCVGFGLGYLLTVPAVFAFGMLPGLALLSPSNGSNVSGIVTLEAAADSEGLVSLQFQVDGRNYGSQITAGVCRAAFDTKTAPDGPHTVQALAQDTFGNTVMSTPATIFVNNLVPAISGLAATNVTVSSATIVWTTLVEADSQVAYGVTSSYGSASLRDYGLVLNHALTLTGLAAGTTYHLHALSTGENGILSSSGDFVFTTAVMPTPTPMPAPTPTPTPRPGVWSRSRGRRPAPTPTPTPRPGVGSRSRGRRPAPTPTQTPTPTPAAPAVTLNAKHQIWSSGTGRWVCDAMVSAVAPDATAGWRAQFQLDGVNLGGRGSLAQYRVTGTVSVGAHRFRLVWSRTGQPSLTSATVVAECR